MVVRGFGNFRGLAVLMLGALVCCPLKAASINSKTLALTGNQAENLYKDLSFVAPEAGTTTKRAFISVIQEYDGPGPFTYFATSFTNDRTQTYKIAEAESLFTELFADGKGLETHGNEPVDTETIIDALATCVAPSGTSRDFVCTFEQ